MPASAGVTRRSVIALLEDMGYTVKEEEIPIDQALDADEVFTTGTAVVVSSVGSLTYEGACGGHRCCLDNTAAVRYSVPCW